VCVEEEENECVPQLIRKEGENDDVSSPHGSLIQMETKRKSRATRYKKVVAEYEQRGGRRGGKVFWINKGKSMVNEK
jgi:hypothetical protein